MFMRENSELRLYLNINKVIELHHLHWKSTNHILTLKINVTVSVEICTISMYLFAVMVTEPGSHIIPSIYFD